jgi:DNA-binding NtrC family response regulator
MTAFSGRPGSRTILVIEDDPAVLQLLHIFLAHGGYETVSAVTADAADGILREREPCAVLFDLSVVRAEPAARLRAWRAARPGTPFILCTGWDPARLTTLFGEDPPDGFLPKPFTSLQLHAELRRAVRLRPSSSSGIAAWQATAVGSFASVRSILESAL